MFTVEFDSRDVIKSLRKLALLSGRTVVDVARNEIRLWAVDNIRMTNRFFPAKGRKKAIQKEMSNIFAIYQNDYTSWTLQATGAAGGSSGSRVIKAPNGTIWLVDDDLFKPDASMGELRDHHERARSSSSGKVPRTGSRSRKQGNWRVVNRMHVRSTRLKRYVRERQKRVRRIEAGWVPAIRHYDGKLSGSSSRIPVAVMRNVRGEGRAFGNMDRFGNGDVGARNSVPYAEDTQKVVIRVTGRKRQREMLKNTDRAVGRVIKRFNRGRV